MQSVVVVVAVAVVVVVVEVVVEKDVQEVGTVARLPSRTTFFFVSALVREVGLTRYLLAQQGRLVQDP